MMNQWALCSAQGMTSKAIPYLFKAFAIDAAQSQAMSGELDVNLPH
jgi:hypothetical protein